ncbi:MAG: Trk system potassium transporter TrkA [Muribaculaceae bacterium]|nr:Trk system potassium transporter TrkA [Muribaculaceae bacterium]
MRIVIAGAGDVGLHLAKLLSKEEQDIVLIDKDQRKLENLDANYNLMTLIGSPTSFSAIKESGAAHADLFIAVTPFETSNITACSIARYLGAKSTVARIDNYEFMTPKPLEFFKTIGVNHTIYPEYLAAQEIKESLKHTWVRHWFELHNGQIFLLGVKVGSTAKFIGQQLKEITRQNHFFHVSGIRRRYETIIPRGDDYIRENDILYLTATRDQLEQIRELCGKTAHKVKKVMIMGGSRIAVRLIDLASDDYRFKIIEMDPARCRWLADRVPTNVTIVQGDARDNDVLIDAGIEDTDAYISLTDSSEANILACLTAKEFGVKKTVAEVENIQFVSEAEALNIGTIINKKLLCSARIFQLLLDVDDSTSKCLALPDAEVAQIEVKPGSRILGKQVKDMRLSRDMTLAGLVRDGKGQLVSGTTQFQPGDQVVVFCLEGSLNQIEKLFS